MEEANVCLNSTMPDGTHTKVMRLLPDMGTVNVFKLINLTQQMEITNYVNVYRTLHQVSNLAWDNTIATFAQSWSDYLLANNIFMHSGNPLYGENLAYFRGYGIDIMTLLKLSIDMWYKEHTLYDYTNPTFSTATGHFTCLVWKNSVKFGMGISISDTGKVIISMNTSPAGNVLGEFKTNVFPPIAPAPAPAPAPVPIIYIKPIIITKLNSIINELRYVHPYYAAYYATINILKLVTYINELSPF